VWFGEALDEGVLRAAFAAAAGCDACVVVGTSAVVYPAAGVALAAARAGAAVIEVNAEETALSGTADVVVRGAAGVVVPELLGGDG
jgi:NAD-dependent deacetylase